MWDAWTALGRGTGCFSRCFAALGASVAVAQNPQAKTEAAAESPPDLLSGETPDYVPKASTQPAAAPKEVAPTPNASPVVASIRSKLAELDKTSSSDDCVALEELLQRRGEPLWMTDMGFSREALAVIDEILRAEIGAFERGFRPPAGGRASDFA